MKIANCPKKLASCPGSSCPLYPCWAYEAYLVSAERAKNLQDKGWK